MNRDKAIAYLMMTGSAGLLVLGIALARIYIFKTLLKSLSVFFITLALHVPQIPAALEVCSPRGISRKSIFINTIIYGAAWWKPAGKGVFAK
jgi:hypothetical protein